ncbi:hypothetical protein N9468_04620 [Flavobacteriaceae bacterium]|nr:hypothetical protein [Flavobacteriaceae bacterium]
MANLRLPAFIGGELAPKLWGRTDLDRYITSSARIENFIPLAEGGLDFRPGTDFVGEARYINSKVRLIPFKFNEDQAYVLEFGEQYIRVLARSGGVSGYVVGEDWDVERAENLNPAQITLTTPASYEDMPFDGTYVDCDIRDNNWSCVGVKKVTLMQDALTAPGTTCACISAEFNEGSGLYSVRVFTEDEHDLEVNDVISFTGVVSTDIDNWLEVLNNNWYRVTAIESTKSFHIDTDVGGADDTDGGGIPSFPGPVAQLRRPDLKDFLIEYDGTVHAKDAVNGMVRHFAQIDSPWTEDDIFDLDYDQSADIMTITHRDFQPRELKRWGHAQWEIAGIWFYPRMKGPLYAVCSDIDTDVDDVPPPTAPGWIATDPIGGNPPFTDPDWPAGKGAFALEYEVTAISDNTHEESIGTYTYYIGSGATDYMSREDWQLSKCLITWPSVPGAASYNVYKRDIFGGRDYGYIGNVQATSGTGNENFEDRLSTGDAGDFAPIRPTWGDIPPTRRARNPFGVSDGLDTCPRTVTIFQQRRFFAGTDEQPQGVYSSQSAAYNNFNVSTPQQASDAITAVIAAQQIDPIVHLVKMRKLIFMTSGGEWYVEGDDSGTLTPAAFEPVPQTANGCSTIKPLLVGGTVVYVEDSERRVRDMAYEYTTDSYQGSELTVMSRHLFDDYRIVDWSYAKSPNSLIHVVRNDGTLLTLTYLKEHQVWAWSRHTTKTAVVRSRFESVCSVPEGEEDGTYVVVRRYIGESATEDIATQEGIGYVRYIERFRSEIPIDDIRRDPDKRYEPMHLDCGITTKSTPVQVSRLIGGAADVALLVFDNQLMATGDTFYIELAQDNGAAEVGGYWTLQILIQQPSGWNVLFPVGTDNPDYLTNDTYLHFTDTTEYLDTNHQSGAGEDRYHQVWPMLDPTVSGLDHLAGETVAVVGDGNRLDDQIVSGIGEITLSSECWTAHVGLHYDGVLETLPLHDLKGALAGKQFSVPSVVIESYRGRGFEVGPIGADDDDMRTYPSRTEGYMETADSGSQEVKIDIPPGWGKRGRLLIKHTDPLPCSILSVTPKVVTEHEG